MRRMEKHQRNGSIKAKHRNEMNNMKKQVSLILGVILMTVQINALAVEIFFPSMNHMARGSVRYRAELCGRINRILLRGTEPVIGGNPIILRNLLFKTWLINPLQNWAAARLPLKAGIFCLRTETKEMEKAEVTNRVKNCNQSKY